jgi:hypothetical protein
MLRQMRCVQVAVVVGLASIACAQAPVSLREQLTAQYKLVRMGTDSGGFAVMDPGTLLRVQKGGVLSVPWQALATCPAKFENNSFHASAGFCAGMMSQVSKYYAVGDKVYPVKIEVNLEKAKVSVTVVACDSCSGVNPPTAMKGQVIFQFAKGYLEKAGVGEVEDAIGQVFAISNDDQQGQGAGGAAQGGPQQQAQQPEQQAEPQTVQLGMTTDQVQAVLGKPEKIFNVGTKQIYTYKDVKVTFLNGKVADVQ